MLGWYRWFTLAGRIRVSSYAKLVNCQVLKLSVPLKNCYKPVRQVKCAASFFLKLAMLVLENSQFLVAGGLFLPAG